MGFAPEYVRSVLNENFEDAKALFLRPLMAIHHAHLVMLAECGIVSTRDARLIRDALAGISFDAVRSAAYDGSCEDLFFYVDRMIAEACGEDVAGRLHTARSRNDIDMTMYRMRQREGILAVFDAVLQLRESLIALADRHRDDVFTAHTHTQPAQPTTVAHYLLGVIEQLERDAVRLRAAFENTNRSPLGACAITGTGFPIDRRRTARLLGFDAPTGNTYGSIATVDYLLESSAAISVLLVGLGRAVQDFLLWCTTEFGYLRLGEGYVQCSSIMPQKRNPVALEHARAIGSKAAGQAAAVLLTVHNTPFGDIVDTEDDLQPLVFSMFKDAIRAVTLVAAAMADAEFDRARMAERAAGGWITITELADTLTRDHDLPFKTSHAIAARLVAESARRPDAPMPILLREIAESIARRPIEYGEEALAAILSPRRFVEVRTTEGGPAPSEAARALAESRERLEADRTWADGRVQALKTAEQTLQVRSAEL